MNTNSIPLSAPVIYSLEITSLCNNRCVGCSNVFTRDADFLPASKWLDILEFIAPHAKIIKLTGGEPTLHPEFQNIVQAVASKNIPFTLFTNGRWTSCNQVVKFLRETQQCRGLLVSLHGANKSSHEAFTRQPDSFTEACHSIRLASSVGLRVHVSTVITRWNWKQTKHITELSRELGAQRVVFNRYIGPEDSQIEPQDSQLLRAIIDIKDMEIESKQAKFGNCIPQCFIDNSSKGCLAGLAYCTIDPLGNMRPCNHSPLVIGNALEQPIEQLWHSEKLNQWRELLPNMCVQCGRYEDCHGGCKAMIEIRHKEQDPLATEAIRNSTIPHEIRLFEGLHPKISCLVKMESSGYVLIGESSLYILPNLVAPIVNALTGKKTLNDIHKEFGQNAVNLVGVLYEKGLVELC